MDRLRYSIVGGSPDYSDFFEIKTEGDARRERGRIRFKENVKYADAYNKRQLWQLTIRIQDPNGGADTGVLTISLRQTSVGIMGDTIAIEGPNDKINIKFVRVTGENLPKPKLTVTYRYRWNEVKYMESKYLNSADFSGVAAPGANGFTEGQIIIPANQDEATLTLTAVVDSDSGIESVLFEVADGPGYAPVVNNFSPGDKVDNPSGQFLTKWVNLQVLSGVTLFGDIRSDGKRDATLVHTNDVRQGGIGDCALWTTVVLLIENPPTDFSWDKLITQNGTEFKVHFPNRDEPVEVSLNLSNGFDSARLSGDVDDSGKAEVWTLVLEQAYLKIDQLADGGAPAQIWKNLTGIDPPAKAKYTVGPGKELTTSQQVIDTIKAEISAGRNVSLLSSDNAKAITANHGFAVLKADDKAIYVYDPLWAEKDLKFDEIDFAVELKEIQLTKSN